ncbi:DUF3293 domain-containing protein [Aerolutibacter ruishenii]|nr:DUF3293 domain-containing protein [Lysobacter ruishenii]
MREVQIVDAGELAAAYAQADYAVRLDGDTFRLKVGSAAGDVEAYWPAMHYAFITAWNPASRPTSDAANQRADSSLVAQLKAIGAPHQPAWAEDTSGDWRESGWLVAGLEPHMLDALAHEFGQAGVLHWDQGRPVRLKMYLSRPPHVPPAAHIDWVE